jgi:hypothetical protein
VLAVFMFGVAVGNRRKFDAYAGPSLAELQRIEPVVVRTLEQQPSMAVAYNRFLELARAVPDLEGLVLMHEDVRLDRPAETLVELRRAFASPLVGVVGVYGCTRPRTLAWHTQDTVCGQVRESRGLVSAPTRQGDVDVLDGLFLAISARALDGLALDEGVPGWHGYDADLCLQIRRAGWTARVIELDVFHATKGGFGDRAAFVRTDWRWRTKWQGDPHVAVRARRWRAPLLPVVTACAPVIATALETRERAAWGDRVRGLRRSVLRSAGPGS